MGFKKAPSGRLIYDFDFEPMKLVPLTEEQCGFDNQYVVKGANGEVAPILIEFQGCRHKECGFSYALKDGEVCIISNIRIEATFAKLYERVYEEKDFDPWYCENLARKGICFDVMSESDAKEYLAKHNIPRDKYELYKRKVYGRPI